MWLYYVTVISIHGVSHIDIDRFNTVDECEKYMKTHHARLVKEYYIKDQQNMKGSSCVKIKNLHIEVVSKKQSK